MLGLGGWANGRMRGGKGSEFWEIGETERLVSCYLPAGKWERVRKRWVGGGRTRFEVWCRREEGLERKKGGERRLQAEGEEE